MGFKKGFYHYDFIFYAFLRLPYIICLFGTLISLVYSAYLMYGVHFYGLDSSIVLKPLKNSFDFFSILLFYIVFRRFNFYEKAKYKMKEYYNFSVCSEEIEVFCKNKNIKIPVCDIEYINIFTYSSPFRWFYKSQCAIGRLPIFSTFERINGVESDSNFCKIVTVIEIKIKDSVDVNKFQNYNSYYKAYNFTKTKKNEVTISLYEIMYNETSVEDIKYIRELYKDLIK